MRQQISDLHRDLTAAEVAGERSPGTGKAGQGVLGPRTTRWGRMTGPAAPPIPKQIGPCRFGRLGAWITVQCPPQHDTLMRNAGGTWDPDHHRWLIEQRRIGPLLRHLRRRIDTLFRQAGVDLDAAE